MTQAYSCLYSKYHSEAVTIANRALEKAGEKQEIDYDFPN